VFSILARQIINTHPHVRAAIVTQEKDAQLKMNSRSRDRVRVLSPRRDEKYDELLERALKAGYPKLFAEKFSRECYAPALKSIQPGRVIVTQMDSPLGGKWVVRELLDSIPEDSLVRNLAAVIGVQRVQTLCENCRKTNGDFYTAQGCAQCSGTGRRGEVSLFDVWRTDPNQDPAETESILSFRGYALELAQQGLLSRDDVDSLQASQLYRTFRLLTASEQHNLRATQSLKSQVTELQVASRTHEQQYLASFALQQVGHKLLELDTVEELAAYICRRAHDLCGADRAVLYLLHHDQTAEIVALNGWDARWLGSRVPFDAVFPQGDISEGHARFETYPPGIPKRAADIEGVLVRAGLRVPLIAQREDVGAMIFHSTIRKEIDTRESALLHALANAGAAAIQRADLIDSLRDKIEQLERAQKQIAQKERLERELELARTVQQNMLPHQFPLIAGVQFYARNEPARQVGGDFYDVFLLDTNRVGLVIADVSDKGMPAALFMALTRSLVRAEAQVETSPERVLRRVHRLLLDVAEPTQFVTLFYGVLDVEAHRLRYVRAGHDYPLLVRDGTIITLRSPGTILGLLQEQELILNEEEIELRSQDRLVLYTDGITDAMNLREEQFDRARLEVAAVEHGADPIATMGDAIFQAVAEHRGAAEPFDDMTLLIVGMN
jgi:serine phosphatase RsbU (regulator of sigma subunit)